MGERCVQLSRKFFASKMWGARRQFSEWEAWVDMIYQARTDNTSTTSIIDGKSVVYGHAQLPVSKTILASRWEWSVEMVVLLLKNMEGKGMITIDSSQGVDVITVCEYDDLVVADNL